MMDGEEERKRSMGKKTTEVGNFGDRSSGFAPALPKERAAIMDLQW